MECYVCGSKRFKLENESYLLIQHFFCEECGEYYVEPGFQSRLDGFLTRYDYSKEEAIKKEMERLVKKYKKVYFIGSFEHPLIQNIGDDFIYIELNDILNRLGFIVDDNSRGSDYGD